MEWRVGIFLAGAVLALAGIYLDEHWMTGLAIIILMAGIFIRFLPSASSRELDLSSSEDNDPGPERLI
ncbi:MAG TPA: hypothetical protein EYO20_02985 [Gemmatimonadetes bacterium]|nr:hypothetical protein [Gemmatimonadota bacterium]HIC15858.1 hypothetical protein [Gemmatimonadota bacterium]